MYTEGGGVLLSVRTGHSTVSSHVSAGVYARCCLCGRGASVGERRLALSSLPLFQAPPPPPPLLPPPPLARQRMGCRKKVTRERRPRRPSLASVNSSSFLAVKVRAVDSREFRRVLTRSFAEKVAPMPRARCILTHTLRPPLFPFFCLVYTNVSPTPRWITMT